MSTTVVTQQPKQPILQRTSAPPQSKSKSTKSKDPEIEEEINLKPEIKNSTTICGFSRYPLEKFLGGVDKVVVSQNVEKIETATSWLTLGCCKVETENRYELVDLDSRETLFVADEDSHWCLRNPCCCCDCMCWCCHSDCASRRSFTMNLTAESLDGPLVLEMNRPCASDCMPCCLQSISVRDKTGFLGSVQQRVHYIPPFTMCGLFEVSNSAKEVIYSIHTPCVLTTCCCTEVAFTIVDKDGNEVGDIAKQSANVAKEALTDADRFLINFPDDCDAEMKAVLIGALFLFDYLFYED